MQIGIIGAGAVGGVLAALLHRAGHTVEITARGQHLAAIRAEGIAMTGQWGDHTADVIAGEKLGQPASLVIVTTKAQDAAAAISANREILDGTPILVIQNGLSGIQRAMAESPRSPVIGGLSLFAASYLSPGSVSVTTAGATYLGCLQASSESALSDVERILTPVMPVQVLRGERTFVGLQWTKLIINQINALPAITGLSAQDVIANPDLRRVMTASMREAVRLALASGVRFGSLQGLSHSLLSAFARLPLVLAQALPAEIGRRLGPIPNPGSTLQSIARGQLTEIDFLNGAVVEAARAAGRTAPINATLVRLVHEVEVSGKFFLPRDVLSRLAVGG